MSSLADIPVGQEIKLLLLGDSGSGKTVGACSFPGPVLLCDFDGKASSAASFYRSQPELLKNVEVVRYTPSAKMPFPARDLNIAMSKLKAASPFPYRTIIIDSITTFVDETLKWLMKENAGVKRPDTRVYQVACMTDYGILQGFLKQFIAEVLTFPCNVIFTAHIQTDKDEQTGEIMRTPLMPGKLARSLPIYFEEVWRLFVRDGKHLVQTEPDARFGIVRKQLKGLPKEFEFSHANIMKHLG